MPHSRHAVIDEVIGVLRQGRELLTEVDDAVYRRAIPPAFAYGTGTHVRHCLDFFACFLRGVGVGIIDYNRRGRDQTIEESRGAALERLDEIVGKLSALTADDLTMPVEVRLEGDTAMPANPASVSSSRSSGLRELQFLQSHTIHHFAVIAALLRLQDVEPGAGFGVAPSTLRHWRGEEGRAA